MRGPIAKDPKDYVIESLSKKLADTREKLDARTAKNRHLQDDNTLLRVENSTLYGQVKLLTDALGVYKASSGLEQEARPAVTPTTSIFGGSAATDSNPETPTPSAAPAA